MIKCFNEFTIKAQLKRLLRPILWLRELMEAYVLSDELVLKRVYKRTYGRSLRLDNPILFSEKIQWLKLYDRKDIHTICSDKLEVRSIVKSKIGEKYLIPLVYDSSDINDICAAKLPDYPVIIKATNNSGGTFVIDDKRKVNYTKVRKIIRQSMSVNYYYQSKEWQYKNIKPRFVVEKLMTNEKRKGLLDDYKFYCFNGEVKFIQVMLDRAEDLKEIWFDTEWNIQDVFNSKEFESVVHKPKKIDEMISIANKLSEGFSFVRVDLYEVEGDPYFGELTFHPLSGFKLWRPVEWDKKLGDMLSLSL